MRYKIYPLVAPLAFAAAFSMYHWEKLTLELAGWNLMSAYALFALPSLIVARVDTKGLLKFKTRERLSVCVMTMMLVTVPPFLLIGPGALYQENFILALAGGALAAAIMCFWLCDWLRPGGSNGATQPTDV
jgi:hypothetical protein